MRYRRRMGVSMRAIFLAVFFVLAGCLLPGRVSDQLDRTAHVVSDAIALTHEAAPRIDSDCVAAMTQTEQADDLIELCDPIVAEYTALREKHKALREKVEHLNEVGPNSVEGRALFEEIAGLTDELERSTSRFRATLEAWPKLRGRSQPVDVNRDHGPARVSSRHDRHSTTG